MFGGMGNMGNMAGMMKKVQKMQNEMMNGEKQVQSLTIDPSAVDPEDVEMLQDLLMAAFNESTKKVDDMMASEMGKLTSGLGLPPGLL